MNTINSFNGMSDEDAQIMAACAKLDRNRFASLTEYYLDRIGDEAMSLYPDSQTLEDSGVDVVALAKVLGRKLSPTRLGKWHKAGLDLVAASKAIALGLPVADIHKLLMQTSDINLVSYTLCCYLAPQNDSLSC